MFCAAARTVPSNWRTIAMRKVIKGKAYDTADAHLLAQASNGRELLDSHCIVQRLFRRHGGGYFLYTQGGAATEFAEEGLFGTPVAGERIEPITFAVARKWARSHGADESVLTAEA